MVSKSSNTCRCSPTWKRILLYCLSIIFILLISISLSACGDEDNESTIKSDESVKTESTDTTRTATTATQSSTPTVETVETPTVQELTALGATREAWDANHDPAPGYSEGAVYLPLVSGEPKFYMVQEYKGIIQGYGMNLSNGPDIDAAKLLVSAELPNDATILEGKTSERCFLADIQSATLTGLFGEQVPIVVFYSGSGAYTPSRIEYVTFATRAAGMEKTC